MFKVLDIEHWPRRSAYEFFKDYDDPFFNITANIDVTRLIEFCRANDLRFSLAALFHAIQAVNDIREFRLRLIGDEIVEFETIHATQTILNDDESFSFCYFENRDSVFDFDAAGKAALEKYKRLKTFDVESDRLDLVYCSVIPWVSFTSFKHASRLDRRQTVPRIVFGKMFNENGVVKMPISVEVNHAMMDGLHVGRFFTIYQQKLNDI